MKTPLILAAGLSALATVAMAQPYGQSPGYGQGQGYGGQGPGYGRDRGGPPRAILFSKAGFQGKRLMVDRPIGKLDHFDFDDKASSIRVHGPWLVCEDDHYGGHCETIDHPIDDLDIIHMNNKISSIRPLGPGGPGGPPPGY
jgi:hypothetical protein